MQWTFNLAKGTTVCQTKQHQEQSVLVVPLSEKAQLVRGWTTGGVCLWAIRTGG